MKKLTVQYFFGIDTSKKKLDIAWAKELEFLNHQKIDNKYDTIKAIAREGKVKTKCRHLTQCAGKIIHRIFAVVAQERMYEKDYIYRASV